MSSDPIKITIDSAGGDENRAALHGGSSSSDRVEDRFSRLRQIHWWKQETLLAARVVVVGAGALGNEIIKNLSLLGVGRMVVIDLDRIELSNLARSVLFRETDIGRAKAEAAAARAREMLSSSQALGITADVCGEIGAGIFRWADLIVGGLDNREARLHLNRLAWRFNKPFIDGAIEQLDGIARTFIPDAAQENACYECTLGERDWQLLAQRRSCALLSREQMQTGHTPTTPTVSSIIGAIEVQEAVKLLHGIPVAPAEAFVFRGLSLETERVRYTRNPSCLAHETLHDVIELDRRADEMKVVELLDLAREMLGDGAVIDVGRDLVTSFACTCGKSEWVGRALSRVRVGDAVCTCGLTREAMLVHQLDSGSSFGDRTLAELGVPRFDVLIARKDDRAIGLELSGDGPDLLGELYDGGLRWA